MEYFKLIKYPANENFIINIDFLVNLQCEMFKFFFVTQPSLYCPKTKKTSQYLIKTDFLEGNHVFKN